MSTWPGFIKNTRLVFPGGPVVKNLPANAGDTGLIPGPEIPHASEQLKPVHHNCWSPCA